MLEFSKRFSQKNQKQDIKIVKLCVCVSYFYTFAVAAPSVSRWYGSLYTAGSFFKMCRRVGAQSNTPPALAHIGNREKGV
jgi:hypothetical protein